MPVSIGIQPMHISEQVDSNIIEMSISPAIRILVPNTARCAARCLSAFAFDWADAGYWQTNRAKAGGSR